MPSGRSNSVMSGCIGQTCQAATSCVHDLPDHDRRRSLTTRLDGCARVKVVNIAPICESCVEAVLERLPARERLHRAGRSSY